MRINLIIIKGKNLSIILYYQSSDFVLAQLQVQGQLYWSEAEDQGPVTEPIRNHLINDIFIN